MAHGDARKGKWRGNWRMECVASTLHTTSEHGVSSITTADAHNSAASSRLNWRPCRFKSTRPFRWKTKSAFRACAITFQTQPTPNSTAFCTPRELPVSRIVLLLKVRCQLSVLTGGSADRFKPFLRKRHLENLAVPQHFKKSPLSCRTLKVHYPVYNNYSLVPCLNQFISRLTSNFFKIGFYIIIQYRFWFKNWYFNL